MSNDVESEVQYTEEELRQAQAQISTHVDAAYAALRSAQAVADKYKLEFSFSPAYGMGGWYNGDPEERSEYAEDGWRASSQSC